MTMPPDFVELATAVNNWGRWGPQDERGTLNLITDEVVRRGLAAAKAGKRFALALPLSEAGPQIGAVPGRVNPERSMLCVTSPLLGDPEQICFSDDVVTMGLQSATHWDALAHASYAGRLYNGFPTSSTTEAGAQRLGIDKVGTLAGHGVLLDVARARGVDRLDGGYALSVADLTAAEELAGLTVTAGDIVLFRTGQMSLLHAGDKMAYTMSAPGLSLQTAPWLHARGVAAVATDTLALEVFPCERADLFLPVHLLHLVEMGLMQGQNFDLEALAEDCAADGVYEFFLEATPLPFVRGLGGPVAPVAIK